MDHHLAAIHKVLHESGVAHEIIECDPALADTEVFCEHYGYSPEESANAILIKAKTGEQRFVLCLVLANTRLDVNRAVRKRLGVRRLSFADPEETEAITGMVLGGVTPFALPADLPVWVDQRIMTLDRVILGGGNRCSKIIVAPRIFELMPNTEVVAGLALAKG